MNTECNKQLGKITARVQILSKGILPPYFNGKVLKNFASIGVGAGPQGKTFYMYMNKEDLINNYSSQMISTAIFPEDHHLSKYALKSELSDIPGVLKLENGVYLRSVMSPNFITQTLSCGQKIYEKGIAMKHSYNTCTSVMAYECKHFHNGEECKYCEIEPVARDIIGFPERQTISDFVETIKIATEKDNIRSLTITSGTFSSPDEVAKMYLKLLPEIKKITNISIHIQHEPIEDLSLYKELSKFADSAGIFLEIFNEKIRKKICPGKSRIHKDMYIKNWKEAVNYYGRGNVSTTCLLGFGVDYDEILENIDRFAEIGVRTSLIFIRCKSKHLKDYIPTYLNRNTEELVNLFINAASILQKHDLCFNSRKDSGCIGCQGCSAMMEACDL